MTTDAPLVELLPNVKAFIGEKRKMLIDGKWVTAKSGEFFEVVNPATGEVIAHAPSGGKADVDAAVAAAKRAFESGPWGKITPAERGKIIWRIGDLIMKYQEELAQLEALDNGKPISVARAADVVLAAELFQYMAGWCTKLDGRVLNLSVPYTPGVEYHAYTRREPVGVVAQIIPWNFPLLMAAWKLGPALASGCTVVMKLAEETPLSGLKLAEIMQEAGVPDGAVNIITGFGETCGAPLAAHPDVAKVAFTGSTEVGKLIARAASNDLKKVTLELGGKSPNIILNDADLNIAIPSAANAIFFNHGQCCCAGSRLFIQEGVYDEVVAGIAEIARNMKVGPGLDPTTEMGPLVSQVQFDRVSGFLKSGIDQGASFAAGGARVGDKGYFVAPTVITNVREDMKVYQEEIFGPVVTATRFKDADDELLRMANDTIYGLGGGVYTRDISKAHKIAARIRTGTVWINTYNIFDASMPFGGFKQSGWGREMGVEVFNNYLETKSVCVGLG
ncbi:aldehyde dehydrogenase family protein [Sinimarinibacterium sp. NLF-5-8]|uniref:aldehyde dehydrogenase family protein n=1 Tax=Sinimarinibacterium sp. NLF-5-8 TaxID=2698684 RepID=UPI00137BB3C2|nr:aldehyde dehydrogenase family protein [Sinimarinibacterium sp. NLF-5-8]QHS11300.1 aldehyde dehydrogenase family protein [Sinimarinibacterium sp. NLF-5-8]